MGWASGTTDSWLRPPVKVGGRYALLDVLGRGGNGEVWRAHDHITGDHVAVKLLDPTGGAQEAQTRREIASLRAVQVPGVVRLLDEGREGGRGYLVMELIRGAPFPGVALPVSWREIAELTRSLLEILSRVHAAGVVHQDIKPSNVLVHEGQPTLLDFGVAWGGLYDEVKGGDRAGTPAYMAPEQVERGVLSSATDLYSLGTMLFEALSGRLPFDCETAYQMMFARCISAPIPLGSCATDAPAAVVELVEEMIQRDPARRPRDAREVLDRLAGHASCVRALVPCGGDPWSLDELRAMIVGPDRIFHIPEDAAAVLWSRTGGEREKVRSEIDSWVRVGFARRDGARIVLDRSAVDRLIQPESRVSPAELGTEAHALAWAHAATADTLRPGTPGRLAHLMRALPTGRSGGLADVVVEAIASARRSLSDGHTGRGLAALADAWLTANRVGEPVPQEVLRELFALWTELSLVDGTPAAIDRALHELARARYVAPVADLEALLQAAVVIHRSSARAFEEASALPAFAEPALERWRHAVRIQAARAGPLDRERETVESLRAWSAPSADPQDQAAFASWEAWTLYRRGLYVEAAERHLTSVELDRLPASRLSSMVAAASALLEGFHPERALELAAQARAIAAESRLTYLEARACWIERAALYRLDRTTTPDLALVESVRAVGVGGLYAMAALTEAAVAWRGGDARAARELAMAAYREWSAAGRRWAPDMARSLALACGAEAQPDEATTLTREALACPVPTAGLQVLALLAVGLQPVGAVNADDVSRLAALVPTDAWMKRAAILSTDEALGHLRGRVQVG
ncbi:MAG: serine/threonine protein kinase [Myxococcaceae bacterium]|nr:MAG: serine/threonine protein kinase [Myxococcaceae bacterium]